MGNLTVSLLRRASQVTVGKLFYREQLAMKAALALSLTLSVTVTDCDVYWLRGGCENKRLD